MIGSQIPQITQKPSGCIAAPIREIREIRESCEISEICGIRAICEPLQGAERPILSARNLRICGICVRPFRERTRSEV